MDESVIFESESENEGSESNEAIERLRRTLAATIPGLTEDMLSAASVAELEASYAVAKAAFEAGRRSAPSVTAVPAGAPGRGELAPSSPREKIRAGLLDLEVI